MFDAEQYRAVIEKIESAMNDLSGNLNRAPSIAQSVMAIPLLPETARDAALYLLRKIVEIGQDVLTKLAAVMEEASAPWGLNDHATSWLEIRREAGLVSRRITDPASKVALQWEGEAATRYGTRKTEQGAAAQRIDSIAEKTALTLGTAATAGMVFYAAVAAAVVAYLMATIAALVAAATGVLAPAGVVAFLAATAAYLAAIATATVLFITNQKERALALDNEVSNLTGFGADGGWPKAIADSWNDATVRDGDPTEWQVRPGVR
jgi:hypothetical protein